MRSKLQSLAAWLGIASALGFCSSLHAENSLVLALSEGEANLAFRYRLEWVDQDSFDRDAVASTLRVRLNYGTASSGHWSAFIEFDHVAEIASDSFNSGAGTSSARRNSYPVVADPNGTDLNQLYFQYRPNERFQARVGRQRILLDDQRHVGGVGWRQNEQTYDGLSLTYQAKHGASVFYSYLANVNRIFGSEVAAGDHQQNSHLINYQYPWSDRFSLVAYAYLLDNDDAPAFSTNTLGLRARGIFPLGDQKLTFLGELARQSDAANSPLNFSADYLRLQAGLQIGGLSLAAGYEQLGEDNGQGFRTPLATLHAFNGWADQFLATPGEGLEDVYLKLAYKHQGWSFAVQLHDYSASQGGLDFGSEVDLAVTRKFGKRYAMTGKFAHFKSDAAARSDVTKAWLMFTASY